MKTQRILLLCIFLTGINTGFAQSRSHNATREFFTAKNLLRNTGLQKKETNGLQDPKTVLPLITKKKNNHDADLFTQLINWDCKIKVKLNSHFNFILTYN